MPDRDALKPTARVFFALWPDAGERAALTDLSQRVQRGSAGRLMRPETLHLTLVFLGDIARRRLPDLIRAAGSVQARRFHVDFERIACWRHNRIAYLGTRRAPAALLDLVARLEDALDAAGLAYDRRAFAPHITLVRHADCAAVPEEILAQPVRWNAGEFVLVESQLAPSGAAYSTLGRFPLAGCEARPPRA